MLRAADIVRHLRSFIGRDEMAMHEEDAGAAGRGSGASGLAICRGAGGAAEFPLDPTPTAMVDQVQLQQVVSNLVRNAAEALRAGTVHNEVWVCLRQTDDGGSLVDVSDTGPGLDPVRRGAAVRRFRTQRQDGGHGGWAGDLPYHRRRAWRAYMGGG